MKIKLSDESADALSRVGDITAWGSEPTMKRGAKVSALNRSQAAAPVAPSLSRKAVSEMFKQGKKKVEKAEAKLLNMDELQPQDFIRNKHGREVVQQVLRQLRASDEAAFGDCPAFDSDGKCRLKYGPAQGLEWEKMVLSAPTCFDYMWLGLQLRVSCYKNEGRCAFLTKRSV